MAEENTNTQENVSVNAVNTEQNTAQETEDTQAIEQNTEEPLENTTPEDVGEANSGTKVREYETPTLHEGVSRLGRLDQAYPDDEREREDIQGYPDGPINKPPFFLAGISLVSPTGARLFQNEEDLQVKEKGVIDDEEGGNTPELGHDTAMGMVSAIDPEGGPVQYFLRGSGGGQTQQLELTHGTIKLNRLTGEFEYTLNNKDADTNSLKQGENVTETVQIYAVDEDGLESSNSVPVTINIEGTNDKPDLSLSRLVLSVVEGGTYIKNNKPTTVAPVLEDGDTFTDIDPDDDATLSYAVTQKGASGTASESDMEDAFVAKGSGAPTVTGKYGTLSIDETTGKYTYKLDAGKADPLAEGDTPIEEFTVYVRDEHGAWDSQNLIVNITGGNDAPTIDKSSTLTLKDEGKVTDLSVDTYNRTPNADTVLSNPAQDLRSDPPVNGTTHTLTGTVSTNGADVDNHHTLTYTLKSSDPSVAIVNNSATTKYGTITLDAAGNYTYELDTTKGGPVDAMQENEWHQEHYTVEVTDEHGMTASHAVTIDIEGTNDVPTLDIEEDDKFKTVKESGVVDEADGATNPDQGNTKVDGQLYAKGQLKGSDVDDDSASLRYAIVDGNDHKMIDGKLIINGHNHVFPHKNGDSYSVTTWVGTMTLNTDGSYEFKLNDAQYNYLNEGATASPTYIFAVYDEHGAWTTQELTIHIEGTNDKPVLTVEPALTVSDTDSGFIAKESAQSLDVDIHDVYTHKFSLNTKEAAVTDDIKIESAKGYGTVRIDKATVYKDVLTNKYIATGKYEYILDRTNADVKALHANETLQDSFVVYVKDEHGATDSKVVNVTITGAEDAPVFAEEGNFATVVEKGVTVDGNAANGTQQIVNGTLVYEGTIDATDADKGDTDKIKYGIVDSDAYTLNAVNSTAYSVGEELFTDTGTGKTVKLQTITTDNGKFVLNPETGKYTYTLTQESDTIQSLLPGQSLVETFMVKATDPSGLSDTMAILVTTLGTNDAPVIDVTNSDVKVSTNEDVSAPRTGIIVAHDVDHADSELKYSLFQEGENGAKNRLVQTLQGKYGYIELNPTKGTYQYFLDSSKVQSLGKGQSEQETFTVYAVDPLNAHDDISLVIKINGRDDAPTAYEELVTIKEDAGVVIHSSAKKPVVAGEMEAIDIDAGEDPTFSLVGKGVGDYGKITLSADGSYKYTLTKNASNGVQKLNVGETLTDTFKVQVKSGGVTKETNLKVTIGGTNDAPVLTTSGLLGTVMENHLITVLKPSTDEKDSSYVKAVDIDNGADLKQYFMADFDTTTKAYVAAAVGADGKFAEETTMLTTMRGDYGMLKINGDGSYTYTVDSHNPTVSALGKKDSLEDTFQLTVMDEHGATDTEEVKVVIKGAKGGPPSGAKITKVAPATVTENGDSDEDTATSSTAEGLITLKKDGGKIEAATLYLKTDDGNHVSSIVDEYGTLTLFRGDDGKAYYRYTLHEGADAVESLYAGQEINLPPYTVCTIKGNGKESSGQIDITIVGTNDAPKLEPATYVESISEKADVRVREGQVLATDVDTGDILTYSFADNTGVVIDGHFATRTTAYGTMKLDTTNGEYTYTLKDSFTDLPLGSDKTESFDIVVTDGKSPVTATVTVTIEAENAAPTVTLTPTPLEVTEDLLVDGHVEASGTREVTDPDAGESFTYAIADENNQNSATVVYGTYGSLILNKSTGKYRYILDTMSEAVQKLGEGQSVSDNFMYTVRDAHGGVATVPLVVTIHGANDAPVVSMTELNLFVKETGTAAELVQSGEASAEDIDANNTGFVYSLRFGEGSTAPTITGGSGELTTTYGTMTITADGEYTYTVDSDREATKALAQGETVVERVTLLVQDDHTSLGDAVKQELLITLTGTNTAPELDLRPTIAIGDARDGDDKLITEGLTEVGSSYVFTGKVPEIDGTFKGVTDADSDLTDLRYNINTANNPDVDPLVSQLVQSLQGEHGILKIDTVSGEYTYTMDKAYVASLGVTGNTTVSETFTIVARDEYGDIDQQQITMEITGENDAPTVVASRDYTLSEDMTGVYGGTSTVTDLDKDDSHIFGFEYIDAASVTQTFMTDGSAVSTKTALGTFTVGTNGDYSFEVDNDAVQYLGVGKQAQETFTILAKDTGGNVAEDTVTVTINGVNDDPTFDVTQFSASYDEADSKITGTLVAEDIDVGDTLNFSLVEDDEFGQDILPEYGTVAVGADGSYTYTLNDGATLEDAAKDSFMVEVSDNHGGDVMALIELNTFDELGVQKVMAEVTVQAG